jgi:hypothetical protein
VASKPWRCGKLAAGAIDHTHYKLSDVAHIGVCERRVGGTELEEGAYKKPLKLRLGRGGVSEMGRCARGRAVSSVRVGVRGGRIAGSAGLKKAAVDKAMQRCDATCGEQ